MDTYLISRRSLLSYDWLPDCVRSVGMSDDVGAYLMMEWAGRVSRLDSKMGSVPLKIRNLHMLNIDRLWLMKGSVLICLLSVIEGEKGSRESFYI